MTSTSIISIPRHFGPKLHACAKSRTVWHTPSGSLQSTPKAPQPKSAALFLRGQLLFSSAWREVCLYEHRGRSRFECWKVVAHTAAALCAFWRGEQGVDSWRSHLH